MPRSTAALAALVLIWLQLGCGRAAPPSFVRVEAAEARALYAAGGINLVHAVDAVAPLPAVLVGGVVWRIPPQKPVSLGAAPADLPAGDLLIVALQVDVGMRLSAALARPRNRLVYLFIPHNAEERRSLYAVRSKQREETPSGTDS
jgi:hypothetical protein